MGYLCNDNSGCAELQSKIMDDKFGLDASVSKIMKCRVWMGSHCCQDNGMTTLDGKPLLPR
eukprot:55646-Amphidinium_carterae.1